MTQGAPGGLEPAEQERLTKQLGRALVKAAGEGWQRVWAQYRSVGKHVEADFVVTGSDGQQRPVRLPEPAIELFAQLRGDMYRPERGTWLSATYTVEPSGGYAVDFEPDAEPAWRRVPPPIGFQDELRWFPRAEEAVPEWFRVRAGLAPTPATGIPVANEAQAGPATPPPGTPRPNGPVPGGSGPRPIGPPGQPGPHSQPGPQNQPGPHGPPGSRPVGPPGPSGPQPLPVQGPPTPNRGMPPAPGRPPMPPGPPHGAPGGPPQR